MLNKPLNYLYGGIWRGIVRYAVTRQGQIIRPCSVLSRYKALDAGSKRQCDNRARTSIIMPDRFDELQQGTTVHVANGVR